jgi:hypothetical protein
VATAYYGERRSQRQRREILEMIRDQLGDRLFADFMIDCYTENGPTVAVGDLPALTSVWLAAKAKRIGSIGERELAVA